VSELSPLARVYVTAVSVAGLAVLGLLLWFDRAELVAFVKGEDLGNLELFVFFLVFAFLASVSPVETPTGLVFTVGFTPLYAAVLTLSPGLVALIACIGTIDQRMPGRQIRWYRFLFNRGMFALVYGLAAVVYRALLALQPASGASANLTLISAALVALVLITVLNPPLIIIAIALTSRVSARKIAYQSLQGAVLSYAGLAPLGGLLAYLVSGRQGVGFLMAGVIFVLLGVYRELSRRSLKLQTVARGSYVAQSRLIDKKDRSTFGHSERVGILAEATATKMRLTADLVEQIKIGATLHDIGKIAIPDAILHKMGKLTDEEWEILKTHPQEGWDVLREQDVLSRAADIVRSHHENYDGTGYPDGTSARSIPVGGRITRVIDSYDCMTNVRDYRAWVRQPFEALSEIHSMAGTTYDNEVVQAFTSVLVEREPELARQLTGDQPRPRVGFGQALAFPPFLKLWSAHALSSFGDMLTTTGLALAAYSVSRSTLAVGAVFIARALPNLLLGLFAGPLVDRYDRKALMIVMDLLRAGMVGAIPFLLHTSFVVILGLAFLVSTATVVFQPSRAAALPDLVPFNLLQPSNAAMQFAERMTEILGYGGAGAIILLGGVPLLFSIDALTFVISAGLLLTIDFPELIREKASGVGWRQVRDEIIAGLKQVSKTPELRVIFPFSFFMVAAGSALLPLTVPLAIEKLHAGQAGFALLEASIAVGATVGAVISGYLQDVRRGQLMIFGGLGMGFFVAFAGLSPALPLTMIFLVVAGISNMVYLIPMITAVQEVTETSIRGRVFAARFALVQAGILVGIGYATAMTSGLLPGGVNAAGFAVVLSGLLMVVVSSIATLSPALRHV
jgi:HD-GYP domain-containing protein (c-di-GMP phosphodiesterase class II)/MFS family permease